MNDRLSVAVAAAPARERIRFSTTLIVARWDEEQTTWAHQRLGLPARLALTPRHFGQVGVKPYRVTEDVDCNLVTTAWESAVWGGVCSAGTAITNKLSATFGRIGTGTGLTTPTAADTHLAGDTGVASTTSYYALVSAAPTLSLAASPTTIQLTASFGGTQANFAWNEFGCDNYSVSGVTTQGLGASVIFINHGLSSQGTKQSGQTWTANVTISCGNASAVT